MFSKTVRQKYCIHQQVESSKNQLATSFQRTLGEVEGKIVQQLEDFGTATVKLREFVEVCYEACVEVFGVLNSSVPEAQPRSMPNRRARRLAVLRQEKNSLRRAWRATSAEKEGLQVLYLDIKKRHNELRRAEKNAQKRRQRRQEWKKFIRNPYKFVGDICGSKKSGEISASKEEVEEHLNKVYSNPVRDRQLGDIEGLVRPTRPGSSFNLGDLKWSEVVECVRRARAGSAEGLNGLSFKLSNDVPRF